MALEGRPRGERLAVETRAPRLRAAWCSHEQSGWGRRPVRRSSESEGGGPNRPTSIRLGRGSNLIRQQRHKIIFADALQNKERERRRAAVGHQMSGRVGLTT